MNLLKNDVKSVVTGKTVIELSQEEIDDNYMISLMELEESVEDLSLESSLGNDLNTLNEIKNHIDKFGVSEETLSLFGKDLNNFNITSETSKEDALVALEDIIEENTPKVETEVEVEGSEEVILTSAAVAAVASTWALANIGLISIVGGAVAGAFGVFLMAFVVFSKNALEKLKSFKNRMVKNGFKPFEEKKTKLRIASKDKFLTYVNGCESILKFVTELNPADAIKTDFKQKDSLLKPICYLVSEKGTLVQEKMKLDKIILVDAGYTEASVKELVDKGMVLCDMAKKFDAVLAKLKSLSKQKKDEAGEKLSKEDRAIAVARVKQYKEFMKVSVQETKEAIKKIISLASVTVK